MISRKLSDPEKQQILELYHLPGETTSTLAGRYGVSNSTISRILKQGLPAAEYELLIQQKRAGRFATDDEPAASVLLSAETVDRAALSLEQLDLGFSTPPIASEPEETAPLEQTDRFEPPQRRIRRRSSASDAPTEEVAVEQDGAEVAEVSYQTEAEEVFEEILNAKRLDEHPGGLLDDEDDDLDEDDLDEDDLEDEDDLDDEDSLPSEVLLVSRKVAGKSLVQVLPLTQAPIPRTCYLVVDRSSELIARPLREFGDLGEIPEAETLAKTLPIFDNHRVAKRYSNPRTQRVIKLPDGRVLQKTSSHLQAKGITRLLIDGQVYSL